MKLSEVKTIDDLDLYTLEILIDVYRRKISLKTASNKMASLHMLLLSSNKIKED